MDVCILPISFQEPRPFFCAYQCKRLPAVFFFFCLVPPEEHLKPFKSNPVTVSTAHYRHSSSSLLRAGLPSSVGGKGRMKTMKRTRRAQIFGPVELPTGAFNEQRCWESLQGPTLPCTPIRWCPFFTLFVYLLAEERNRETEGGRKGEKERKDESGGTAQAGAPPLRGVHSKVSVKTTQSGGRKTRREREQRETLAAWQPRINVRKLCGGGRSESPPHYSNINPRTVHCLVYFFLRKMSLKVDDLKRARLGPRHPAELNSSANLTHLAQIFRCSRRHSLAGSGLLDFNWMQSP